VDDKALLGQQLMTAA
jgi:cyanate lyase